MPALATEVTIFTYCALGLIFVVVVPSLIVSLIGLNKYSKDEKIIIRGYKPMLFLVVIGIIISCIITPLILLRNMEIFYIIHLVWFVYLVLLLINLFLIDLLYYFIKIYTKVKRAGLCVVFAFVFLVFGNIFGVKSSSKHQLREPDGSSLAVM